MGVPDERLGEEICAIIRLKSGAEQPTKESIIEFVKVAHRAINWLLLLCAFFSRTFYASVFTVFSSLTGTHRALQGAKVRAVHKRSVHADGQREGAEV